MVKIRQATESDIEQICNIGQTVPEFSVSDETVNFWPREIIKNLIHSDEAIVIVAAESTEIYGFIIANCNKTFKKIVIENIYVIPKARNKRVGEQLLAATLSLVQQHGYEYISTLIPLDAPGALQLYTHSGFAKGDVFQWLDKPLADDFKSN